VAKKKKTQLGHPALIALAQSQMANRSAKKAAANESGQATQPDFARKVTRAAVAGGVILLSGGLLFLIGRSIMRGAKYKASFNKTDDPTTPEYHAQRLYQGMNPDSPFGVGTDKEIIRATISSVPHRKFWESVKDAYRRMTKGGNLMDDLASDLSRTEKRDIDMILSVMPRDAKEAKDYDPSVVTQPRLEAWATRINAASQHESSWLWPYGTDEEAVYAVLRELPSALAACQVDRTYLQLFGKGMFTELNDELDSAELQTAYQIIMQKPDAQGKSFIQVIAACTKI
jgi:hypothetical protein